MIEIASIVILGIAAQWLAWRFKIPAILPLILIGLFVGPVSTLFSESGKAWLQPIYANGSGLFPGDNLFYFVSLAIGIILFEGGLTLKRDEIKKVGSVIGRLISIGAAVTLFGGALAAHYLFGLNWRIAFLFAALIIVTGPTVITPILRNIPLKKDVSAILKWEGILIDPIGALVAVLMFEFINVEGDLGFTKQALLEFAKIVVVGFSFGISGGYALYIVVKKQLIPHYLINVVALSAVLLIFVESDIFAHESGLLSVVVMGMFLGNSKLPGLKEILYFKESLSVLLISILFILLAAHVRLEDLMLVFNLKTVYLIAVLIFLIRPFGVFLSAIKAPLKFNEKLFISWVGPRGIVAAGIASLFGSKLAAKGIPQAEYITPLVFAVVLSTVLLNATTARFFARLVGVFLSQSDGIMIVGASKVARIIGKYLQKNKRQVVLVDSNEANVRTTQALGIEALQANIFSDDLRDNIELNNVGYLIAMTGSDSVNKQVLQVLGDQFGEQGAYRLATAEEAKSNNPLPKEVVLQHNDFIKLSNIAQNYPSIQEVEIHTKEMFYKVFNRLETEPNTMALFLKSAQGKIEIIYKEEDVQISENMRLVYLGKPLDWEAVLTTEN